MLDHREIRVSLGDVGSDTYFQATHNEDNSEYVGTWHHPEGGLPDSMEEIEYARVEYNDWKRPPLARTVRSATRVIPGRRGHE